MGSQCAWQQAMPSMPHDNQRSNTKTHRRWKRI
jgi:hypothetical protein